MRDDLQPHVDDDAERAFGSDEEVDEVHAGCRKVAGRSFRHVGHAVVRHSHPSHLAREQLHFEEAVLGCVNSASFDVEHFARREHHRQALDPLPGAAVFERRGPGGVCRHGAAHAGAVVGGRGRVVAPRAGKRVLERREHHSRLDADAVIADVDDVGEPRGVEDDLAHRRRAAGQRRLRTNRQHAVEGAQHGGHFGFAAGERDAGSVAPVVVRRILQKRRDGVGVA
jgi:hypothetical protein